MHQRQNLIDHLKKLAIALEHIHLANVKVNAEKSFFTVVVVADLGFILTYAGVTPQPEKVEAIHGIH